MAYRRMRRMSRKSKAGRVARKVARKSYKGAIRMPKRKLARVYATKCGQSAWRAVKKLGSRRAKRYGRRFKKRY